MRENGEATKLRNSIKQPKTMIIAVALAGLLLILSFFSLSYLPVIQANRQAQQQLDRVRHMQEMLAKSPIPEPYREEEAKVWLQKVPLEENHSDVLKALLLLEQESGAEIESFTVVEEEENLGDLTAQLASAQQQAKEAKQAAGSEGGANPPNGAGHAPEILPLRIQLDVTGAYGQVTSFWRGLAGMERIVTVNGWRFSTEGDNMATNQKRTRLLLNFTVYAAPGFAELSGAAEHSSERPPEEPGRSDPTLTDDSFYRAE